MAMHRSSVIALVASMLVIAGTAQSKAIPDSDQALTMYLTVNSGSDTALPVVGGTVSFECDIQDYRQAMHVVTWTHFDSSSSSWIVIAEADAAKAERVSLTRVQASNASHLGNVHQRLDIREVLESDQGLYRCNVMTKPGEQNTTCKTIASRELGLAIYPSEIFPVCSPSSKAPDPLVPGQTLACGTLTDDRIPVVTRRGSRGGELEAWEKGPRRDGRPGWELTREVGTEHDGTVFDCWSFPTNDTAEGVVLSCTILPRVVGGTEPPPSGLPTGAVIAIAVGATMIVFVCFMVACVCCCCRSSS